MPLASVSTASPFSRWQPASAELVTHPASSLLGHKQTAERAAATGEEEAAGGEAPPQSPGEQEWPQGQHPKRSGCERAGHLGEDLRGSQHLSLARWES